MRAGPHKRLQRHEVQPSYSQVRILSHMDSAAICRLGVVAEGLPVVIPTSCARMEEETPVDESRGSSVLEAARAQARLDLVDELVLRENIFDHMIDYCSVSVIAVAIDRAS